MADIDAKKIELLPCPFCNSQNVDPEGWKSADNRSGPACDDCCGSADSIAQWNTRPREALATLSLAGEDAGGLCAKLEKVDHFEDRMSCYRNPDGPEAAALIRSLSLRVEAEKANSRKVALLHMDSQAEAHAQYNRAEAEREKAAQSWSDWNKRLLEMGAKLESAETALAAEKRARTEAERERDHAQEVARIAKDYEARAKVAADAFDEDNEKLIAHSAALARALEEARDELLECKADYHRNPSSIIDKCNAALAEARSLLAPKEDTANG